ncbi:MAG: lipoate--protein ligase [Bacteroidota bacterium]
MLCLQSNHQHASFNLAMEEYLLKEFNEDVFFMYRNDASVIVGKHQNAHAESNALFLHQSGIPLYRRISGGGTVFHDLGNLNYGFIGRTQAAAQVSFNRFSEIIIQFLSTLGIEAYQNQRNSIETHGLKISGTAEHIFKNCVLHHGTLLFSSQLDVLSKALASHHERYRHKAVESVRSKVCNIADCLSKPMEINEFSELLMNFMLKYAADNSIYHLKPDDIEKIEALGKQRYVQWEWNYGYSPAYAYEHDWEYQNRIQRISFEVKDGIFQHYELEITFLSSEIVRQIELTLIQHPQDIERMEKALDSLSIEKNYIDEIIKHSF